MTNDVKHRSYVATAKPTPLRKALHEQEAELYVLNRYRPTLPGHLGQIGINSVVSTINSRERRKKSLRNSTALNSISENYFSLLTLLFSFGLDVLEIHEGNYGSRLGYQPLTRESQPVLLLSIGEE